MQPMILLAAMMSIAAFAFDVAAQTAPATSATAASPPSSQTSSVSSHEQIQKWFDDLADSDPAVRESGTQHLMALSREDLVALRDVVAANLPIAPSQAVALHDIVIQAYLTSEPFQALPRGFLGAHPDPYRHRAVTGDKPAGAEGEDDPATLQCVVITHREPGFSAYPVLRDGDMVLGVVTETGFQATRIPEELIEQVSSKLPGESITFKLLRNGAEKQVSIRLGSRPVEIERLDGSGQFFVDRRNKGEAYWRENFEKLLPKKMS